MQQRKQDPRDGGSNQQIQPQVQQGSQNVAQANEQPQVQNKSDNPYEFSDQETKLFGSRSTDTSIARAWSRAMRSNHYIGEPTGDEVELEPGLLGQGFQYAYANYEVPELDKVGNPKNNVNNTVVFYDAHGEVCRESGL